MAVLKNDKGITQEVTMIQEWPVKIPIKCYKEKILPRDPLITQQRIIDTFFPVATGGKNATKYPALPLLLNTNTALLLLYDKNREDPQTKIRIV